MQNSTFTYGSLSTISRLHSSATYRRQPSKLPKKNSVTSRDDTRGKFPFSFSGGRVIPQRERSMHVGCRSKVSCTRAARRAKHGQDQDPHHSLGERFHGNLENLVSRIRRQVERHSTDCDAVPFIIISCIQCENEHAQTTASPRCRAGTSRR